MVTRDTPSSCLSAEHVSLRMGTPRKEAPTGSDEVNDRQRSILSLQCVLNHDSSNFILGGEVLNLGFRDVKASERRCWAKK